MTGAQGWRTLRELDEQLGRPKGAAFRAFKGLDLAEGTDFRVLTPARDGAEIAALRDAGRIYRSSVNVVVLSADAAARVARSLGPV